MHATAFITGSAGYIYFKWIEMGTQIQRVSQSDSQTVSQLVRAASACACACLSQIISVINDSLRWQLEAKWRHRQMATARRINNAARRKAIAAAIYPELWTWP